MPETDESADEQTDLGIRKVTDPQDGSEAPGADADGQVTGAQARTPASSLMGQGQM